MSNGTKRPVPNRPAPPKGKGPTPPPPRATRPAPAKPKPAPGIVLAPEYVPAHGSPFSAEDMAVIGPELRRLHDLHGGLDVATVKDSARDPDSPLHRFYRGWDRDAAAEAYWDILTRQLIRSVTFRFQKTESSGAVTDGRVRAFHVVQVPAPTPASEGDGVGDDEVDGAAPATGAVNLGFRRCYKGIGEVVNDADALQQVIDRARRDLEEVRRRYAFYATVPAFAEQFEAVWAALASLGD